MSWRYPWGSRFPASLVPLGFKRNWWVLVLSGHKHNSAKASCHSPSNKINACYPLKSAKIKHPSWYPCSNTSHLGLLSLLLWTDAAITASLKIHTGLEFTNLWGAMFNSWENPKWVRKRDLATPFNVFGKVFRGLCVCPDASAVRLSVFFPHSDACHVTLPFALDHQCQHYIPVWIWFVTRLLLTSPTLAFVFPLLACPRSNRVTSRTDDKEMSDVVKVRNKRQK